MSFDYYLGANTPDGFVSFFEGMTDAVSRLYIIKGGPGCGKSTAMKRIAAACEAAGMAVQRIWCASDTESLDGVYLPELDTLYVDGTAPHVLEPKCPGARDGILNFGAFWDAAALAARRTEIEKITAEIACCYARMYHYLRAAGALAELYRRSARRQADMDRLARRARRISTQHIPLRRGAERGRRIDFFLNTLSPQGPVFLDNFSDYTVCELHDGAGLHAFLTESVMETALSSGYTVYAAHDPLFPQDSPLHLVIPELRFALLTSGGTFGCPPTGNRRIRLDKMTDSGEPGSAAVRRKNDRWSYEHLLRSAGEALGDAKDLHDELEALYRPAVDFRLIDALVERQIEGLIKEFKRKKHDFRSL